ncbi:MAG: ribokinase [Thermoguttaceae bacterium]|nr:ribokinase [Thermoguttaceae bacterium]MDW8037507.1 ribokinase [Thermoguttaceae bacterium]
MKAAHLVVVGSSNTDMVVKAARLPRPGETVTGGQFYMAAGGKGANQAVAAARLGAHVTFVARVGTDMFGSQAIQNYDEEGIDTELIIRDPDHPTGVALILVDEQGENLIAVASGANHAMTPADVDRAATRIREADALLLQLEIPLAVVAYAAQVAASAGVPVILDPAPAPEKPLPTELLRNITYLKPNESEAERLTGIRVEDERSARQAAEKLRADGAKNVIITLGANGAVVATADQVVHVPGFCVEARDCTAAGDAFNAALAVAIAQGRPLLEAVRYAHLVAALSVTRLGAQPSLPTAAEVSQFAQSLAVPL